jgi:transposase-like protein
MLALHYYYRFKVSLNDVDAIDKADNLIDVYLSDTCDQEAKYCGVHPYMITTDKEPPLYKAMEDTFGDYIDHPDNKFMNHQLEQDHRGTKLRIRVMKIFKNIFNAQFFCTVFEKIRKFFRMKNKIRAEKRSLLVPRFQESYGMLVK